MIKINNAPSGISAFQWSTSEQVYPFEVHPDGSTLYCKKVNMGSGPNNDTKTVAHGISPFSAAKIYKLFGYAQNASDTYFLPIPYADTTVWPIGFLTTSAGISVFAYRDITSYTITAFIIYKK